jgi:acyl carrier protein
MNKAEFFVLVAEVLEIEPEGLKGSDVLEEIGTWDSLAVISFVAMVDREFDIIIEGDRLHGAKTLDDLAVLVGL